LIAVEEAANAGQYGQGFMTAAGWAPGMPPSAVPPGWFPDPGGQGLRYWDGLRWTEHTQARVR
jgi:hypothetical protein